MVPETLITHENPIIIINPLNRVIKSVLKIIKRIRYFSGIFSIKKSTPKCIRSLKQSAAPKKVIQIKINFAISSLQERELLNVYLNNTCANIIATINPSKMASVLSANFFIIIELYQVNVD